MSMLRTLKLLVALIVRITIIDGTPIEATESDSDVYIFKGEDFETDEEPKNDDFGLNCINQTSLTHLFVVGCDHSQPAEKDDWRKSVTVHTFIKIGDKNCKIIMDSGSCINTLLSKLLEYLGLEVVPHPPFKVSWIDSTILEVK